MKITDFVVCEDIRDEVGNKFSLMGIFNDKIKLQGPAAPAADQDIPIAILSVFVRCLREPSDFEPKTVKFRGLIDNIVKIEFESPVPKPEGSYHIFKIRIPGFVLRLGNLIFELTYTGDNPSDIFVATSQSIQIVFELVQN